jgi:hypothetical protein
VKRDALMTPLEREIFREMLRDARRGDLDARGALGLCLACGQERVDEDGTLLPGDLCGQCARVRR